MAVHDHQGGEDIALVEHEALAVAPQIAVALQPRVEIVGELRRVGRTARIEELELVLEAHTELFEVCLHRVGRADEERRAVALIEVGIGGADDSRLLALGEDDALGMIARLLERRGEPARHGIEAAPEP